jgi:hypothetical protein
MTMPSEHASRRTFPARSLTGIGSTWITASWSEIFAAREHAHHAAAAAPPAKFEFLTSGQAADCDGSSFVTSGRGQPTRTIQALDYRAADRIADLARRGEIPSPV